MAGIGAVPVKAKVPRQYAPLVAAGLVLFEADSNSDLYGGATIVGNSRYEGDGSALLQLREWHELPAW